MIYLSELTIKNEVVYLQQQIQNGLKHLNIFGLDILSCNNVKVPFLDDPLTIFIQTLIQQYACSAHVGPLAFGGGEAAAVFGSSTPNNTYERNRIGLLGGTFYNLDGEYFHPVDACFFPTVHDPLLGADEHDFKQFLLLDALALYVSVSEQGVRALRTLYAAPFLGKAEWLQAVATFCDCILLTGSDGDYLEIYAQHEEAFALLDPAIACAAEVITASAWYKQNKDSLEWDGDFNMCMIAPENRT